jgi:hypothetical protein
MKIHFRSVAECWEFYKRAVYKDGLVPDQEQQLRDAFYASSAFTMDMIEETSSSLPEDQAMAFLNQLHAEHERHARELATREKHN